MKTFEKFLNQIESTEKRTIGGFAPAQHLRSPLAHDLAILHSEGQVIAPKQINNYLAQNDLSLDRFINDKLLRERVIKGDDILDVNYLEKGLHAGRAVCRINIISSEGEEGFGTGFMIAPDILITNNHVLPNENYGRLSYAEFSYEKGKDDLPIPVKIFRFEPSRLFYTNEELDFTIIAVHSLATDGSIPLSNFAFLKLNPNLGKTKEGNYVSIIQHPDGKMKKVAIRENQITNLDMPKFIRYVTDTKSGSSGAPVFNDKWDVVALHHAGIPNYDSEGRILNRSGGIWDKSQGEIQVDWIENEGVRVSSIVYDITTKAALDFPFLLDHFSPLTDLNAISKSMGIDCTDLEKEVYYPEKKDIVDRNKYYQQIADIHQVKLNDLHTLLKKTHTNHRNYSPSKFVYPKVDIHADGLLRSIYSGKQFTVQELTLADQKIDIERQLKFIELTKMESTMIQEDYNDQIDELEALLPYNCEHVVCQSWFSKQEPMRGDLHHLFACESRCNSFRSNHPYHEFPNYEPEPLIDIEKEMETCGNMENDLFEPENNKGIVARAVLYYLVRYPKSIKAYDMDGVNMLVGWAMEQPITLYEKHRNREIFLLQGNRNPFIDFPELISNFNFSEAI